MSSEPVFTAGDGRTRPLVVRRSARARALRLAVDPRDGAVRLTLPSRQPLGPALAWAESKRGWVERQLAGLPAPSVLGPDAFVPLEGVEHRVDWRAAAPRRVVREGTSLVVGGPAELVAPRILRWLRAEALACLEAETRALAAGAGLAVGRVGVGDPRGRWGSCSARGDLRYSWRLILAPAGVRRSVVAHEVAHLRHLHHGPAFHAFAAELFGRAPDAERRWLAEHGARLQAFGRG